MAVAPLLSPVLIVVPGSIKVWEEDSELETTPVLSGTDVKLDTVWEKPVEAVTRELLDDSKVAEDDA